MTYKSKWKIIEQIGAGGQGTVFRVLDKSKYDLDGDVQQKIIRGISGFMGIHQAGAQQSDFESLRQAIVAIMNSEDQHQHGALKVIHQLKEGRDSINALERLKREIKAMQSFSHPNLVHILDSDPDGTWYVSRYYPKGTLSKYPAMFKGNVLKALTAFRPLVEAVSQLHFERLVHRDIKPLNIFLDSQDQLILGDFGLIHFSDQQHTRISETWDNVGSRDWQPGWSMGIKVDELSPAFDVFCLGKLLWSMISGLPILPLWYYNRPQFDVTKIFPVTHDMILANRLFAKCIVEEEEDCLGDAGRLLKEVDDILSVLNPSISPLSPKIPRPCRVCGLGIYKQKIDRSDFRILRDFGLDPVSNNQFKVFVCGNCGHVQLFSFDGGLELPAWN